MGMTDKAPVADQFKFPCYELGKNYTRSFCGRCKKENFITEYPEESETLKKYMASHFGAIFGIVIAMGVVLFFLIICIVRRITRRKEKLISVHIGSPSKGTSEGHTDYNDPVHA